MSLDKIKYLDIDNNGSQTERLGFRWWLSRLLYKWSVKVSGLTGEWEIIFYEYENEPGVMYTRAERISENKS